jgi:PKD repeat protein
MPGETLAFIGNATVSLCSGAPTYEWNFGDGTPPSASPSPSHAYASAGTYTWQMTASSGAQTCTQTRTLTVLAPPVLYTMANKTDPFRIAVTGSNLKVGVQAFINGTAWPNLTYKNETKVVLKGGASLKNAVPKGAATIFRFVNPDGGWAEMTWTR